MSRLRPASATILGIDHEGLADKLLRFMLGPGSEFPENNALVLVDKVLDSHRKEEHLLSGGAGYSLHHVIGDPSSLTREELAFLILRGAQALLDDGIRSQQAPNPQMDLPI